ncbi:hypothetical protein QZM76_29145, partial [Burkholderia multivorans]|nr:hypothetical protein [Burkholderia multivorans]
MAELPNHDAALTETCLESESIFEGAFLKLKRDTVSLPDGKGNTDQFGLAVIADEAKGVVERSSRNGPTTMQRQIGFAEAESA